MWKLAPEYSPSCMAHSSEDRPEDVKAMRLPPGAVDFFSKGKKASVVMLAPKRLVS